MTITGKNLIAGNWVGDTQNGFSAFDVKNNCPLNIKYTEASLNDVNVAVEAAHEAFSSFSRLPIKQRADFLRTIGEQIMALGDELVETACAETGLPEARIIGERGRTVGQLNLYASVVEDNEYEAVFDSADPERKPLPKPDTRLGYLPLGVVGVFAASNFPLAYSTAGGDTASALAAGCPVVMKGHTAHPGTAELVAQAIHSAIEICGIDKGVFSLIQGENYALSTQIVQHPLVKAVGFTGSERVGMILQTQINQRPEPIPFYGELGSVNPQFILPNKMNGNTDEMATSLIASMMMGNGQFCTSPGIWIAIENEDYTAFETAATNCLKEQSADVMLTPDIKRAFDDSVKSWLSAAGVECLARGMESEPYKSIPALFSTSLSTFTDTPCLHQEVFGPCALIVKCVDFSEMRQLVTLLKGNLTASIHADETLDIENARTLSVELAHKVGRLIFNQMPTGVEVCASMNHGGPFPASTNVRTTSVGNEAIKRFQRPICYQNMPHKLLPIALQR